MIFELFRKSLEKSLENIIRIVNVLSRQVYRPYSIGTYIPAGGGGVPPHRAGFGGKLGVRLQIFTN